MRSKPKTVLMHVPRWLAAFLDWFGLAERSAMHGRGKKAAA